MPRISLITIGNELLKGRIVNTNATDIADLLRRHGYGLDRVLTVADTGEDIRQALVQEMALSDVVLTSGGLGPTRDDITKHTLAALFDSELVWDADTLAFLELRYRDTPQSLTELTRQQALVPARASVLPNPLGTAPGLCFSERGKLVFVMPGVPFEMLRMLEHEVLPRLASAYPSSRYFHQILRLIDIPESLVAVRMEDIENRKPEHIGISYLPREDGIWLEIGIHVPAGDGEAGMHELEGWVAQARQLFADTLYATGEQSPAQLLLVHLQQQGLRIAIAESMTGGRIAARLVEVAGASNSLTGAVTAYDVAVKTTLLGVDPGLIDEAGVVSQAVATEMAAGVRRLLGADIGLATTGIAEATDTEKARVWIGYADAHGTDAVELGLRYRRVVNLDRATQYALIFALKKVRSNFGASAGF
ncbi:MAG: competence/damage-inducible protein A [Bacteroidia bacterium]